VPRNIYGVTKAVAEDLCQLFHRNHGLACMVLRTSRFFPEEDDDKNVRDAYLGDNARTNELLFRRVDIEDAVSAHILAWKRAPALGFGRYIISATTPFLDEDLAELRANAPMVVRRRVPAHQAEYERRGWTMFPSIDRVYINERARHDLGWRPHYDFAAVIDHLAAGGSVRSPLAERIGIKDYHRERFIGGPYPLQPRA
jgi:UDP-glucose 4-epimerase